MRLEGKTALITGAGSGFGAEMARRFVAEGARVACVDIDAEAAAAVAASLGDAAIASRCDVADGAAVEAMVEDVVRRLGAFDTLVNNAAITQVPRRIAKTPPEEVDRLFEVNVKSLYPRKLTP